MNQAVTTYTTNPALTNARLMLSVMLIGAACVFADILVGTRSIDTGTDTGVYASVFLAMRNGLIDTRFEPAFLLVTAALSMIGVSLVAYQSALFLLLVGIIVAATRQYHRYLGSESSYLTFLIASLTFLFLSPLFMNASINAVRQGLASLLVFAALLAFQRRSWRRFVMLGLLATCFHYSSLLYLVFAPALLLNTRILRGVGVLAFLAYCAGLTMLVIRVVAPAVYTFVMSYEASSIFRSGVRIDFAVFSMFWYVLPHVMAPLVRQPIRDRIKRSADVYLVLLLPFFLVGWGSFSNRYLLPAWMAMSLIIAAIFCHSRLSIIRNPLVLRLALIASCGFFYYYITHGVLL